MNRMVGGFFFGDGEVNDVSVWVWGCGGEICKYGAGGIIL